MLTRLFALLAMLGIGSGLAHADSTPQQETIVLILVDAMRPDHMGIYGYDRDTTPTLDALGAQGTVFTRAYANAPWTRPSTASFLTGLHGSRHGAESAETKLPQNIPTLAEKLRAKGWTTAAFVANGNGGSLAGLHRGFDIFEDPTNTYDRKVRGKTYNGLPRAPFIVDRASAWMRQNPAQKLFLFIFLVDPHDPYRAPPDLERQFLGDHSGPIRRRASWEVNNTYSDAERFSMKAIYDAGIRYADDALATFFTRLRQNRAPQNTTILVSADHGEGFGEHGFYLHAHHFWDEVVRIPLLAIGPRFAAGRDDRLTQSLDVTQTILDLAGEPDPSLPGSSLLAKADPERSVISEYNEFGIHRQAIIGPRYKVIWQRPADLEWYMRTAKKKRFFPSVSFDHEVIRAFDMQQDPLEKKDLGKALPPDAQRLLKDLRTFVEQRPAGAQRPNN